MDWLIKLTILYVLNGIAFVIQDLRTDVINSPLYARRPSLFSIIKAIFAIPIMILLKPLIFRNIGIFIFQLFYTTAIYYYVYTEFSIGFIVVFILSLTILRGVILSFERKIYRDRNAPRRASLPHHAAYGSVLRDSADQAESDPGEHKNK